MKLLSILLIGIILSLSFTFAATPSFPSACCEKTNAGAYCINAKPEECAPLPFRSAPSSCSQTVYCKAGTCYDSKEGICMESVPQLVCNAQNGTWIDKPIEEVAQCQLGCCIIADQAAFVSLVRCKRLSTYYGVQVNFRRDIFSEVDCIAVANGQDKGACVYEESFERKCKFTTRTECSAPDGIVSVNGSIGVSTTNSSEKRFYKDYLCSAEQLATTCARQATTKCDEGKVYWYDSCGNRENIYSSNLQKSWNNGKMIKDDSLNPILNNGNDKNNGNCDYLQGARCAPYNSPVGGPAYGNNYCKRTECTGDAKILGGKTTRKNGESWCIYDTTVGNGLDAPGSRHFRYICIDGNVEVEACDDYRARVCFQNDDIDTGSGKFSTAACRVNRWQDCLAQTKQNDCEDRDIRECIWLSSVKGLGVGQASSSSSGNQNVGFSNPTAQVIAPITGNAVAPITGNSIFGGGDDEEEQETASNRPDGICVPNYPPGLQFWNKGEATSICGTVSAKCIVTYKQKGMGGDMECEENCDCLKEQWAASMNNICKSVGDCGGYVNYLRSEFTHDGYNWAIGANGSKKFSPNTQNTITAGLTGKVIGIDLVQNMEEEE